MKTGLTHLLCLYVILWVEIFAKVQSFFAHSDSNNCSIFPLMGNDNFVFCKQLKIKALQKHRFYNAKAKLLPPNIYAFTS